MTCDTWHVTMDTWHIGYGEHYVEKIQVPSTYGLGMVKKWHIRGNSNDNTQSILLVWGRQAHKGGVRGPRRGSGGRGRVLSASYIPLANIFKKNLIFCNIFYYHLSTSFLLKFILHCYLPNLGNVSNTSVLPNPIVNQ